MKARMNRLRTPTDTRVGFPKRIKVHLMENFEDSLPTLPKAKARLASLCASLTLTSIVVLGLYFQGLRGWSLVLMALAAFVIATAASIASDAPSVRRVRAYLGAWLVLFTLFALSYLFFGFKSHPTVLAYVVTVPAGIGAITGLGLVKGIRLSGRGTFVLGLFVPLQPLAIAMLAIVPAKSGSVLDEYKRAGGSWVNLANPFGRRC